MTVLIVVPTYETISTETYKSLWELSCADHELMFDTVKGYDCALARISACEKAISYGVEWLLMVDSDTVLPQDALDNMLEHDADVCLGYYQHKRGKEGMTCLWKFGNWTSKYMGNELRALHAMGTDKIRVQGGGMGCTLIRTSILKKLPKPWFRWVVRPDGSETGEDVYFCNLCKEHGIEIYADTRVACGHAFSTVHNV